MKESLVRRAEHAWVLLVLCLLGAVFVQAEAAQAAELSEKKLTLVQYETQRLKLQDAPGKIRWRSSDPDVASVNRKGKVKALTPGRCRITAVSGGKTYTCRVRVQALALSAEAMTLIRGRQGTLSLNNEKLRPRWSSSDESIAVVSSKGVVTARRPGACLITATRRDTQVSCAVTVLPISPDNLTAVYGAGRANREKIVLAGSSSMDYWETAPRAFAPYEIINMAIGGTTTQQWLSWYERMIVRYKPAAVVLYVGSNDLGNGNRLTGEENAANTIALLKALKSCLKRTPIFYIGVNRCWNRQGAWEQIACSNALVREYCEKYKYLYYINIAYYFADADGLPRRELFLSDQLHPSRAGYTIWKNVVAGRVKKVLRQIEKQQEKKKAKSAKKQGK